jgi:hypothetical protein
MIFQFTQPIEEVRRILNCGREYFRETALRVVADAMPYEALPELLIAVERSYHASFDTFLQYKARAAEGGDAQNFSRPPAQPVTGLAGGSITPAGCAANSA